MSQCNKENSPTFKLIAKCSRLSVDFGDQFLVVLGSGVFEQFLVSCLNGNCSLLSGGLNGLFHLVLQRWLLAGTGRSDGELCSKNKLTKFVTLAVLQHFSIFFFDHSSFLQCLRHFNSLSKIHLSQN